MLTFARKKGETISDSAESGVCCGFQVDQTNGTLEVQDGMLLPPTYLQQQVDSVVDDYG